MTFLVVLVVRGMVMVTYSGSVLSPTLQHVRDLPEFAHLMSVDRSKWPRCLLWHGWLAFEGSIWGTAEEYGDARLERCRAFLPVPGVMQTVQRAEFWGAILALC